MNERDLMSELRAADAKIHKHPGYKEFVNLQALERSLKAVFQPNGQDLLKALEAASKNPELAFELIQNVREPAVRDEFHGIVTRLLHNYLASAASLVEHARRIMRGRTGPIADEFNQRKADLLKHPEVPFMVDLRNYLLHRTLPFFAHTLSVRNVDTGEQEIESEVQLDPANLLEWDRWTPRSRVFLQGHAEPFALRPLVRKHGELVFELNVWLHNKLSEANGEALDEVNELVVARNMILTGGDREAAEHRSQWDSA
jgi:hypothetical protein